MSFQRRFTQKKSGSRVSDEESDAETLDTIEDIHKNQADLFVSNSVSASYKQKGRLISEKRERTDAAGQVVKTVNIKRAPQKSTSINSEPLLSTTKSSSSEESTTDFPSIKDSKANRSRATPKPQLQAETSVGQVIASGADDTDGLYFLE